MLPSALPPQPFCGWGELADGTCRASRGFSLNPLPPARSPPDRFLEAVGGRLAGGTRRAAPLPRYRAGAAGSAASPQNPPFRAIARKGGGAPCPAFFARLREKRRAAKRNTPPKRIHVCKKYTKRKEILLTYRQLT